MGVGILYRNAVASRVAAGVLKLLNVPELKQMAIQSFIVFDKRKPLAPMAQEFLQILREKKPLQLPPTRRESSNWQRAELDRCTSNHKGVFRSRPHQMVPLVK